MGGNKYKSYHNKMKNEGSWGTTENAKIFTTSVVNDEEA